MLQLKYNGDFLDVNSAQDSEMEKTSPLFLVDDFLAEYSTPFQIKYSDKNARLLGFLFFELTSKVKQTYNVDIYTDGSFRTRGTLVIDNAAMNRDFQSKSSVTGYLLTGISNFFTLIKDKKLSSLVLGGLRTFSFTTLDPLDASDGYWQHIQSTYDFTYDYVFPPFKNEALTDDDAEFFEATSFINKYTGSQADTNHGVSPWTKIFYILQQIFEESFWTLDTSALDGSDADKLILYSGKIISTNGYGFDGDDAIVRTPRSSITINLAEHMPTDVLCSNFIFEICKRFFWFPLCDSSTRVCKLIPLKDLRYATNKDWTKYAGAGLISDFTVAEKIFAFKNEFVGDDSYPSEPNISLFPTYQTVYSIDVAPTDSIDGPQRMIYAWLQNQFYTNQNIDGTYQWVPYGDNIFGVNPQDATDTYTTQAAGMPIVKVQFNSGFYGYVPIVNQERNTVFGIRTTLYHGMSKQVNDFNTPVSLTYPHAGAVLVAPGGTPALAFTDAWTHKGIDFIEYGIYGYWAKDFLEMISPAEIIQRNFYLPLWELARFKWNDRILVHNIPYFIRSYIEPLNYKGFIQAKLQKIKPFTRAIAIEESSDVHFGAEHVLSSTATTYGSNQEIIGPPGATVTVDVTTYSNSEPGVMRFYVNTVERFLADTLTFTLDGSGMATFSVVLSGAHNDAHTNAINIILTITTTDMGTIVTPYVHGYDLIIE